ncbi:cellulase family glycosylhydrolase, partial [Xanthomonas arboricola]|uniref:cellulase family glycosylhydrolase n=1 Tax=Xanthomonas arboricola TaxID=56448 RepID=UPI0031B5FA3B
PHVAVGFQVAQHAVECAVAGGVVAGADRLRSFTQWLRLNHKQGFLGEFGTGNNATCNSALNGMLGYLETNRDVWV